MAFAHEEKPWGGFYTIFHPKMKNTMPDLTNREFVMKVLQIAPHQRTSLQYHKGRAEFLIIVGGTGRVTMPDDQHEGDLAVHHVVQGMCIIIRKNERHRLEAGKDGMTVAEVWLSRIGPEAEGTLDEADVVRLDDDYGRGI